MEKLFLTIVLLALGANVQSQCSIGASYSNASTFNAKFNFYDVGCIEYRFGAFNSTKSMSLTFRDYYVSCSSGASNIIVKSHDGSVIYDFCNTNVDTVTANAYYFIVQFKKAGWGYLELLLDFAYINTVSSTTFAPAPSTSTASSSSAPSTSSASASSSSTASASTTKPSSTTLPDETVCGIPFYSPNSTEMRIVGGYEANKNSWPWQVYITDNSYMCGASIINNQWLLTAAHCVTADPFKAFLGYHDINTAYWNSADARNVVKKITHPNWNSQTLANDIALFKLQNPFNYTDKIRPVCLPKSNNMYANRVGMVTGWGVTNDGSTSNVLKQVAIPFISSTSCGQFTLNSASQFCAGNVAAAKDSCQGDSGGPLVTKEGNNYYEAGIVSFGGSTCNGYGVYTNVFNYVDWIKSVIASN